MTWPSAVVEQAKTEGMSLPPTIQQGMGSVIWRSSAGDRFASVRPILGMPPDKENAKVRWSLWHDVNGRRWSATAFCLPLRPEPKLALLVANVLQGWLLKQWNDQASQQYVTGFAAVETLQEVPERVSYEYWLCDDHQFGIILARDGWEIRAGSRSLSIWKSKANGNRNGLLEFGQLDRLCEWLARNWYTIAYGKDLRPPAVRDREVDACRAYEGARTNVTSQALSELQAWWAKHAFRAADAELPNIFLERQADELVISWDESASVERSFLIPHGTAVSSVRLAIPTLRRLVSSRIDNIEVEAKVKARVVTVNEDFGYKVLRSTFPNITNKWLIDHQFTENDAREMALAGTSRHPVVGLLRSAQGSKIALSDFETILAMLQPNSGNRFQRLREVAKGMTAQIDVREPWRSGYQLARLVRADLGKAEIGYFDIEDAVQRMGIEVQEASFTDQDILAACIGTPQFAPLIIINSECSDARGTSGRRITLAHELCHLLFDRSRMQSFARFEGGTAESDRLIEMRANAFAVELLAPIKTFFKSDQTLMTDAEAERLSLELEVSAVAIRRHVRNHQR